MLLITALVIRLGVTIGDHWSVNLMTGGHLSTKLLLIHGIEY